MLSNSSFLITGGTGSFGKTLIRHLLNSDVERIVCLSRDEDKQHLMSRDFSDERIHFQLGDVRDPNTFDTLLKGIDYVFHAAALKHVPASEYQPLEFVKTNILGSQNLLSNISKSNVKGAVFLSTDKAVAPVNTMGMTKSLMEKLVRASNDIDHRTCITRYGNVIGSRGSVIPQFLDSLRKNGSVDVTNPKMTRFLMSLNESVALVLHALENGETGDLFIQKSPAATVETIVLALSEILGIKNPIINIMGNRPGEKMHETLLTSEEKFSAIEGDKYFRVPKRHSDKSNRRESWTGDNEDYTSINTNVLNVEELVLILRNNSEVASILLKY
jgi:UDP-glucose 4-epimerase